jgi:hypothetical protein
MSEAGELMEEILYDRAGAHRLLCTPIKFENLEAGE